jgi:glycine/D-amino acid oxidase-like deaminating enzyme
MRKIDNILQSDAGTSWQDVRRRSTSQRAKSVARIAFDQGHKAADVIVIGGGMAGMLSAYLLSAEGKSVIVLEKDTVGSGVTAYTTAFLTQVLDTDFKDLVSVFGMENAKKIVDSHRAAYGLLQKIAVEHSIDCDFRTCSNYLYANTDKQFEDLKDEHGTALELGIESILEPDGSKLGFQNKGYVEIRNQAKFHPLKFLEALRKLCEKQGVKIYEHTEATDVLTAEDAQKKGHEVAPESGVAVLVDGHVLCANWAIVATYEPFNEPLRLYFKKGTYTTYVLEALVSGPYIEEAIYEDLDNPYHYFRIDNQDKEKGTARIIIGGEDHRSDIHVDPERNFNALLEYLDSIVPSHDYEITGRWTGPILEPIDGLAAIGPLDDDNILYATGFSGTGMTYSAIAATLLTDHIMNRENELSNIYAAHRLPTLHALAVKGRDYVGELIHGAASNFITQSRYPSTSIRDDM